MILTKVRKAGNDISASWQNRLVYSFTKEVLPLAESPCAMLFNAIKLPQAHSGSAVLNFPI